MKEKVVYCKKPGEAENKYVQNSLHNCKTVDLLTKSFLQSAVDSIFTNLFQTNEVLKFADLGCATGQNTLAFISIVRDHIAKNCQELNCQKPEMIIYLNDLSGSDFNCLFRELPRNDNVGGNQSFVMGVPGSFYSRLFPRNSLHVVHSSLALHWLSQAPNGLTNSDGSHLNKDKIYISKTSPIMVEAAYRFQFQHDFKSFLKSRSEEVVTKGVMILTFLGKLSPDPSDNPNIYAVEQLADAISQLVAQGLINREKLDSFNIPYYIPSQSNVREIVETEDSFTIQNLETLQLTWKQRYETQGGVMNYIKGIRSFTEPLFSNHFGEHIVDKIYDIFASIATADWGKRDGIALEVIRLVLQKK